jgi:hypothetical protein
MSALKSRCTTSPITSSRRDAAMTSIALPRSGVASGDESSAMRALMPLSAAGLQSSTASSTGSSTDSNIGQKHFSHDMTINSLRSSHRA